MWLLTYEIITISITNVASAPLREVTGANQRVRVSNLVKTITPKKVFDEWKTQHAKQYANPEEEARRYDLFAAQARSNCHSSLKPFGFYFVPVTYFPGFKNRIHLVFSE